MYDEAKVLVYTKGVAFWAQSEDVGDEKLCGRWCG